MLATVTATEYVRPMDSGRTCPVIVNCERPDGSIVTTVAKFSDFCDQKEVHLAREIVAACLAGDLGLPIPTPVLIEVPPGWADTDMKDKQRYGFVILRYVHDVLTSEFVNVGVVMYLPSQGRVIAKTRNTMGRLRGVFPDLDRVALRPAHSRRHQFVTRYPKAPAISLPP
jgi:hypothetical protein